MAQIYRAVLFDTSGFAGFTMGFREKKIEALRKVCLMLLKLKYAIYLNFIGVVNVILSLVIRFKSVLLPSKKMVLGSKWDLITRTI